ncbi:MAG: Eco57I restriction-modification methylase domain-containing protein, partial [Candidatus Thorarchaeota archaeon]
MKEEISLNGTISFIETPSDIAQLMADLVSPKFKKKRDINILDSGCGRGIFLNKLQKENFSNVEGLELNKELYQICKKEFPNLKIYNNNYLTWDTKKRYDVIIGNPPYAHYNSLPLEIQEQVYEIVKNKESDIYYAFILKSIDLLEDGGELIYIVPYSFFYNTFAKIVREKIISNGYLELVIDLDEIRLFKGENPETIIFKFKKRKSENEEKTVFLRIKNKNIATKTILNDAIESINKEESNNTFQYHRKTVFSSSDDIWTTYPLIEIPSYTRLKDIAWIGVGLVTGYEKAFILSEEEIKKLNLEEKNKIIKLIKARHCKGFSIEGGTYYFLIEDSFLDEEEIKKLFPNLYEKILPYKQEMTERYLPNNKKWFHWQALRNYKKHKNYYSSPKIYVPNLDRSKVNRFSLSKETNFPSGDVLTIVPLKVDPYYLLGYLNSNFFREYYLSAGARRGHRITFTQRILANIKIPKFEKEVEQKIASIAKKIYTLKQNDQLLKIDEI